MELLPNAEPIKFWVERSRVADRTQFGTYLIAGVAVAGYEKPVGKPVAASVYSYDEQNRQQILMMVEGRKGPIQEVEIAKAALAQVSIARHVPDVQE